MLIAFMGPPPVYRREPPEEPPKSQWGKPRRTLHNVVHNTSTFLMTLWLLIFMLTFALGLAAIGVMALTLEFVTGNK